MCFYLARVIVIGTRNDLKSMSWQPLIKNNAYLEHNFPEGLAFIP